MIGFAPKRKRDQGSLSIQEKYQTSRKMEDQVAGLDELIQQKTGGVSLPDIDACCDTFREHQPLVHESVTCDDDILSSGPQTQAPEDQEQEDTYQLLLQKASQLTFSNPQQ